MKQIEMMIIKTKLIIIKYVVIIKKIIIKSLQTLKIRVNKTHAKTNRFDQYEFNIGQMGNKTNQKTRHLKMIVVSH